MVKPEDFGGGKTGNPSCVYCSNPDGNLKPRNIVRQEMIRFWMSRKGADKSAAEEAVDKHMAKMPAWKKE